MVEIRPASIRDASAIVALLMHMHAEATVPLAAPNEAKIAHAVIDTITRGAVFVAIEGRRLVGSIGGVAHENWWTTQPRMYQLWWYVTPQARTATNAGLALLRAFRKGLALPVEMNVAVGGDSERMDRLCARFGLIKTGSAYTEN